jgi:hypothetical protein
MTGPLGGEGGAKYEKRQSLSKMAKYKKNLKKPDEKAEKFYTPE